MVCFLTWNCRNSAITNIFVLTLLGVQLLTNVALFEHPGLRYCYLMGWKEAKIHITRINMCCKMTCHELVERFFFSFCESLLGVTSPLLKCQVVFFVFFSASQQGLQHGSENGGGGWRGGAHLPGHAAPSRQETLRANCCTNTEAGE